MTPRYEPHEIEAKWQRVWEDERAFNVPNPVPGAPTPENHWYQLEMLPYPSGPSLHMGHVLNYRREGPVNWCPNDQTVIANEYVVDGRCERCGAEVELRNMTQWYMRTTAYADELLEYDLPDGGFWPERTKAIQRNWIGRSEGAEILFRVEETAEDVAVFTTRADTLHGATFFVLAPEHPFVAEHASEEAKEYARHAGARPVEERAAGTKKTGVFTGLHAINPINDERLPIWVADY